MIRKEVFKGMFVGLIATIFGLVFAMEIFGSSDNYAVVIEQAIAKGFLGKLISIGAILNLGAFFIFIKKKQDHRAKGVLIMTIIVMLTTFAIKFLS
ncbi:hypothetical protein RM697_07480 [Ichthyenterobacterium sp. W332]|uniref:DUF4064 domain-containing protein n=1 Tax=Microcosmobacter mediterraneus TaxID=3075607 RepID=A0ABU2YK02_9FLAO|nr:hypothetical protein [Ichthyenterobacterium sp. W332]MDT0558481.1 hypothetical protein [Ichthyenterobacterium sp. W332]